jgi:hypothetical protein
MQTQEVRLLLEQKLGLISQKAYGLLDQTTKKASTDCGVLLEDMDVVHGSPGTSRGRGGVSVLQYPGWAQTLSEWSDHAVLECPVGEWRYQ